jgi:hypothetical protein
MTKPKSFLLHIDGRGARGHFIEGNRIGKGRPPGARNKNRPPSFLQDDPRLGPARRFRTLVSRMAIDLGGVESLSAGQQQLIRPCAMISVQCELMEQKAAEGETFDVTAYSTLTGQLTRTLTTLGLKREPRDMTPTLRDYLNTTQPSVTPEGVDEPAGDTAPAS